MKKQFRFASFGALLLGTLPIILLNGHAAAQSLEEEAEQLARDSGIDVVLLSIRFPHCF